MVVVVVWCCCGCFRRFFQVRACPRQHEDPNWQITRCRAQTESVNIPPVTDSKAPLEPSSTHSCERIESIRAENWRSTSGSYRRARLRNQAQKSAAQQPVSTNCRRLQSEASIPAVAKENAPNLSLQKASRGRPTLGRCHDLILCQ